MIVGLMLCSPLMVEGGCVGMMRILYACFSYHSLCLQVPCLLNKTYVQCHHLCHSDRNGFECNLLFTYFTGHNLKSADKALHCIILYVNNT